MVGIQVKYHQLWLV